ncbi:hypothetical protein [Naumannella huperziae]
MSNKEGASLRRVRFFGVHDLAAGWFVARVARIVEQFDPSNAPTDAMDIIELHNVQQYLENGFLPRDYTEAERLAAVSKIGPIRSTVAKFFSAINDADCVSIVVGVDFDYHADLLELLGRNMAFERCTSAVMLAALDQTGVHLRDMLACKKLVLAYDAEVRDRLIRSPANAEHIIRKYLQRDVRAEVHLPARFTPADARDLLERYVDSPDANPNYIGLIETARVSSITGIDAKLKLRAKRRNAEMTQAFFENNTGLKTGAEVRLSESQNEPVLYEMDDSDGMVARFTYSSRWLDETCDNPSILNNFQHLFEFADHGVLLTLPSYPSQLGVSERFLMTTGKTEYMVGARFRAVDMSTLLQTRLYQHYLETKKKDLEGVIFWFFEDYLKEEFGAANFSFRPSSRAASYLERVRHLFAEMESMLAQFSLFVENGELDRDLLAITSNPVRYREVPSLLPGKYVYATDDDQIAGILHALFSDQSALTDISEELNGDDAAGLLIGNVVSYADFREYQQPAVDHLISLGILEDTGERVQVASVPQFLVLRSLFAAQACSYYRLSQEGRSAVDAMESRGWVRRHSSLLTEAEAQYFNYFLNKTDFSNGPELRNKYLHGSQADVEGEDTHFHAYVTALRTIIALVIKVNDDFCLWAANRSVAPVPEGGPSEAPLKPADASASAEGASQ